jgi:alkanesulfonate monooxygenase SsuD/methylene tetrahydromethanopterin reductase-like flavin-dependent oxidoreductase (luciferase family)
MVNIGVVIPNPLPAGMALPDIARLAHTAEIAGLDGIWAEDGLSSGDAAVLDLMCVLAACAAASEKIEVGSAIFALSLRNLSWALKQVATVQLLARGRLRTAPSRHLAAQSAAAMQSLYGVPTQLAETLAIGGTPQEVADQLARYLDAGAVELCLVSNVLPWSESWSMLADVRRVVFGG